MFDESCDVLWSIDCVRTGELTRHCFVRTGWIPPFVRASAARPTRSQT